MSLIVKRNNICIGPVSIFFYQGLYSIRFFFGLFYYLQSVVIALKVALHKCSRFSSFRAIKKKKIILLKKLFILNFNVYIQN